MPDRGQTDDRVGIHRTQGDMTGGRGQLIGEDIGMETEGPVIGQKPCKGHVRAPEGPGQTNCPNPTMINT